MMIIPDIKNPVGSQYLDFLANDVMFLCRITKKELSQFDEDPVE